MKENLYKVVMKGSKEPITIISSRCGPLYKGRPSHEEKITYIFYDWLKWAAWDGFIRLAKFYHYKDVQLLFNNKVIAEAYRNPKPKDDYDIYRIKLKPEAPKDLKDFVLKEIKDGKRFVNEHY